MVGKDIHTRDSELTSTLTETSMGYKTRRTPLCVLCASPISEMKLTDHFTRELQRTDAL